MNKEQLHNAMVNFQRLEFMLRGAIDMYEQIIRDQVKEYFEYPHDQNAIDRMVLGKLADRFSKYTNNNNFKTQVDSVIKARNKLAHATFIRSEIFSDVLGEELLREIDEIYKASELASNLSDFVFEQTHNIYFDPDKKKWVKD